MADNVIQLPPDSTGQKVRTQTMVIGGQTVNVHYFVICDETGNAIASTLDSVRGSNMHLTNATIEKSIGAAVGTLVILAGTSDGTNAQAMRSDSSGRVQMDLFQLNGIATAVNNGTATTGVQRVCIASDNTAFGINLAQYTAVNSRLPVDPTVIKTITNNFSAPGTASPVDCSVSPVQSFAIQVVGQGGAATLWTVNLEGSLDNSNFTTILQHTQADGDGATKWGIAPVAFFRSTCSVLTLGGATSINVTLLGIQ